MNGVARERGQREVNGDPRNAPSPRNACLSKRFKKNLDAPGKRPRPPFTDRAMNWGCHRTRVTRSEWLPQERGVHIGPDFSANGFFHLTTCTGNADFYPRFNFIQRRPFRGNQRVSLNHSIKPAKPIKPPEPDVVKVLSSLSKIVNAHRGKDSSKMISDKFPDAATQPRASPDTGPARNISIKSILAGAEPLKNRAVGGRVHALVSPPFAFKDSLFSQQAN
jgi:hypothetical protein